MYVPTAEVSTFPLAVTSVGPWNASLAVAPGSTYVVPSSIVCVLSPFNVMTGGISSL